MIFLKKLNHDYYLIFFISGLAVIIRVVLLLFFFNPENINTYEYGEIAANLKNGLGYSIHYFTDQTNSTDQNVYPSAYMPPGYVYLVYFLSVTSDSNTNKIIIIISQIIISAITISILYFYTKKLFTVRSALISSSIYVILPEFIFATFSITPTVIFHLFILMIFVYLAKVIKTGTLKSIIITGLIFGLLILLRSEIIILLFLFAFYFLYSKKIKAAIIIFSLSLLFLSPWIYRNYTVFHKFIPATTSFGQNLFRGHNPYQIGVWSDEIILGQVKQFKEDQMLELRMDEIMTKHAINFITNNPLKEIGNSCLKIFHLWIMNPLDKRSNHPLYIFPWILILALSIIGLRNTTCINTKNQLYIYLIYFSIISIVFFVLPRYQTMMKIMLLPYAGFGAEFIIRKMSILTQRKNF